jgi:hypothetical protein
MLVHTASLRPTRKNGTHAFSWISIHADKYFGSKVLEPLAENSYIQTEVATRARRYTMSRQLVTTGENLVRSGDSSSNLLKTAIDPFRVSLKGVSVLTSYVELQTNAFATFQ